MLRQSHVVVRLVRNLNQLLWLRTLVLAPRRRMLARQGVFLPASASISLTARLRPHRPGSIRIGEEVLIAFKVLIYSYDPVTATDRPVTIEPNCFIGGGSTITPGVTIGEGSIVGAGSVVFDDIPPRSIVAGNPARVIRSDVDTGAKGRLRSAAETTRRLWRPDD